MSTMKFNEEKIKNHVELDEIYDKLLDGSLTCEEASNVMSSSSMKNTINKYIYHPNMQEDLQSIIQLVKIAQFIYNNSTGLNTGMSDTEYDILYSNMIMYGGADIVSVPTSPKSKRIGYHKYPALRGTLTKVFYLQNNEKRTVPSRRYLDEWKTSMENKILQNTGDHIDLDNAEIYVFPKFDGISCIFEFDEDGKLERALTRGFTQTNEAQDITHIFKYYNFGNMKLGKKYGLKTEIMVQEKSLEAYNNKYKTDYKNTRSIAAAILNSDDYDIDKIRLLHVVPLRIGFADGSQELSDKVFDNYPYIRCRLADREIIRKFSLDHAYVNGGLRCDGAVIYIIDENLQKILGRENDMNNFEVAYKFTEESTYSRIKDIEYGVGLFGRISPVAIIEPVKLKGNTINNVSLGSIGRVRHLALRYGDRVKILYDIIPYLTVDDTCIHNNNEIIGIPKKCPSCGSDIVFNESGDVASCINPNCDCRKKGKILNYLIKMGIDGISYGVLDKLYDAKIVCKIQDIYNIKDRVSDIISIDGFGSKMVRSWVDEIEYKKVVFDYILLGSLGIEGISKKLFLKVLKVYTIDELIDICENGRIVDLVSIPGIKETTATKIIIGINDNIKLIKSLMKILDVVETSSNSSKPKFTVCFTKVRDSEKELLIESLGGQTVDSLTKDTTFLVVPSKSTQSSKVSKAEKYGIKIIPIDDLEFEIMKYLNNN